VIFLTQGGTLIERGVETALKGVLEVRKLDVDRAMLLFEVFLLDNSFWRGDVLTRFQVEKSTA
jgi:hypothetical protein